MWYKNGTLASIFNAVPSLSYAVLAQTLSANPANHGTDDAAAEQLLARDAAIHSTNQRNGIRPRPSWPTIGQSTLMTGQSSLVLNSTSYTCLTCLYDILGLRKDEKNAPFFWSQLSADVVHLRTEFTCFVIVTRPLRVM